MRGRSTHTATHLPDSCGSCAHFATQIAGKSSTGYCRCWRVKGKDGNYARRRSGTPACTHYVGHEPNYDNLPTWNQ